MTEYNKTFVNLWVKEDKHGLPMLSGKSKASGTRYFMFTDTKDQAKKRLAMAPDNGDLVTIGDLMTGESDHGVYLRYNNYMIVDNRFYDDNDPFIKNREGEYVLNTDGEKIPQPEYTLIISEKVE